MLTRKETSARLASLAGKALRDPSSVTHAEIRELAENLNLFVEFGFYVGGETPRVPGED